MCRTRRSRLTPLPRAAGETIEFDWSDSTIYPGTSRRFWVHVPARYDPARPASLMVFQDGWWYLDPDGEVRGAVVLDNLVQRGDIPVTIGVFVDPGVFPGAEDPKNRNTEYDAFHERYVSFLLDEIIPEVTRRCAIAADPGPVGHLWWQQRRQLRPSPQPGCARTSSAG
ncbi:hypothetical protein [Streptomyces sp. NPDC001537]